MNIRQMSYDVSVKNISPRVNSGVVGTLSYGAQGGDSFGHKYGKIKKRSQNYYVFDGLKSTPRATI